MLREYLRNTAERLTGSIRESLSQPPRRFIQTAAGVSELPGSDRRAFWILGRRFVRQNVFEVSESLPEAKRKSALGLLVRKWSPFPSTRFAVQWVGHRACVYAWDGAAAAQAIADAGRDPARVAVWPETFFRAPLADGVRLSAMTDGVEGQIWKGTLLTATRWWPAPPPPREWATFLRAGGIELTQAALAVPAAADSELLPEPWTTAATPVTDLWSLMQNERAAAVAAAVIAAPFLYYLTQSAVLSAATLRVQGTIADMESANRSIREDRSAAFTNLGGIESYLSLQAYPQQFVLMNAAMTLLSASNVAIAEWNYDAGSLELLIQADRALEAPAFIQMFEQDPHFSNVSGTVGNQQRAVRLSMQVEPQQWPAS